MGIPFSFGPIALTTTTTTNLLNPGTTTGGVNATGSAYSKTRIKLKRIRIVNKTSSAATFSLWLGATGGNVAGTEFLGIGYSVAANSGVEFWANKVLTTADFLVGGASANTTLTIEGDGEVEISG